MNYDYHFLEHRQTPVLEPELFKLDTAKPAVWLQKLCCWTLRKLGSRQGSSKLSADWVEALMDVPPMWTDCGC